MDPVLLCTVIISSVIISLFLANCDKLKILQYIAFLLILTSFRSRPDTINTRPRRRPSVQLETDRPGIEATVAVYTRHTDTLPYISLAHAHQGIITCTLSMQLHVAVYTHTHTCCIPRLRMRSEVYSSVSMCFSCSMIIEVQVRASI